MSNIVTVNSGSAIGGSLKAGRVSISTDSSVTPSSGGKTWYNMINPAGGYTFISDPKIQGYNDGPPILYPTQTTLPSDILATINGLPDRRGSVAFDNVWDALIWVQSTGKYFILDKTLSGVVSDGIALALDFSQPSSYPQSGSTAFDLSGNDNNGTLINGPIFNSNGWVEFDGVDDYGLVNRTPSMSPTAGITQEGWIRWDTTSNGVIVGVQYGTSSGNSYALWYDGGNWRGGFNTGAFTYISSNVTRTIGKWYHFLHTWDGSTQTLYLNGESISSGALSGTGIYNVNNTKVVIGGDFNGPGYDTGVSLEFPGVISKVRIYSKSLSLPEILQNYYQSPIVTDGLVLAVDAGNLVSYENGSTTTYSLTGSDTGTLNNGVDFDSGYGGTWKFDGTDDYISFPSNASNNITGDITCEAWFFIDSDPGDWVRVLGKGNSTNRTYGVWYNYSSDTFLFQRYNSGGGFSLTQGSAGITLNKWYHIAGTSNGSSHTLYINGQSVATTTTTGPFYSSTETVNIGDASFHTEHHGYISTSRLYNRGLTAAEVQQNYNTNYPRFNSSRDIPKESMALELDAHNPDSYLSGTTWNDLSGNGNNGTLNNGVEYTTDNGGVLDFDGTDDYISIPNSTSLQNTSNLTLEAWVKLDTNVGYYTGIIGKGTSDANEEYCILILPSTGKLYMDVGAGGGPYVNAGYAFALNTWYHIAGTHERVGGVSTIKVYVNGVYQPSTTNGSTLTPNSNTTSVTIGSRFSNGGSTWPGQIALARIYTRTLTHDEILNSYTSTAPRYRVQLPRTVTDSLALDVDFGNTTSYPRKGTTVYDRSGNGNNGTATNGPPWEFTNGGIFDFDGTDDYINFNSPSSLDFIYTDPFSLEIWINPDATSGFKHLIGKSYADYRLAQNGTGISFRLDANLITTQVGTLVAGEWTHIVATWDPITSTARVYQDGILQGSITNTAANWTATGNNFQIGTSPGEAYYFDGKIALGRAYSKTLSNSEVLENYTSSNSRFN